MNESTETVNFEVFRENDDPFAVGSGYAVDVQEKKVVIMKESTTEPAQQTPAEPGTMLQV